MSFNRSAKRPVGTSFPSSIETSPSRGMIYTNPGSVLLSKLDSTIIFVEDFVGGAGGKKQSGGSSQSTSSSKQTQKSTLDKSNKAMELFRATQLDLSNKWNATHIDEAMLWIRRGELIVSLDVAILDIQKRYPLWEFKADVIDIYKETFAGITDGMAAKYKSAYFAWINKRELISSLGDKGIELPEELKKATYDEIMEWVKKQATSHDAYSEMFLTNPKLKQRLEQENKQKLKKYREAQEKAKKTKAANKKKKESAARATEDDDFVIEDDDGDDDYDGEGEGNGEEGGESEQETSDEESDGGGEQDDEKTTSKSEMKALLTQTKTAKGKPGLEVAVGDKFVEYFVKYSTDERIKKGLAKVWDVMTIPMRGNVVPRVFPNVPKLLAVEDVFGLNEMVKLEEYYARRNSVSASDFSILGADLLEMIRKCDERGRAALLRLFLDVVKGVARNTGYVDLIDRLRAPTPQPQDVIDQNKIFVLADDGRKNKASSKNAGMYAKFQDGWKLSTGGEWAVVEDANLIGRLDLVSGGLLNAQGGQSVENLSDELSTIEI